MANIVILGAGAMGTAMGMLLADNGHKVHLVGTHLDGDIIEEIQENHIHPRLGVRIEQSVVPYTCDRLDEAMVFPVPLVAGQIPSPTGAAVDLIVLGVNSLGVDWAAQMLGPLLPNACPVIMATKGLEGDNEQIQILPDVFRQGLPCQRQQDVRLAAIAGPSLAREVAAKRHTSILLSASDPSVLPQLTSYLHNDYFHVHTSSDFVGVEVCAALKNLYALAVGTVSGMLERAGDDAGGGVMHNLAAAIFAQALWEMAYFVQTLGGQVQTVYMLPGAGDLYVTSQGGRNSRMGHLLGLGLTYSEAKRIYMVDATVEGAELALAIGSTVARFMGRGQLDAARLPLLCHVIDIVCEEVPVNMPWDAFFAGSR